jgi:uncharacterized membrane protein
MTLMNLAGENRFVRRGLLISLVVNLFFVGIIGAMAVRSYLVNEPPVTQSRRSAEARIDRIAATLPTADAAILRAKFDSERSSAEAAHEAYDRSLEQVRTALRAEPFDASALNSAMADARSERVALDQVLHEIIAASAAQMSSEGRNRLADWTPPPHPMSCVH